MFSQQGNLSQFNKATSVNDTDGISCHKLLLKLLAVVTVLAASFHFFHRVTSEDI